MLLCYLHNHVHSMVAVMVCWFQLIAMDSRGWQQFSSLSAIQELTEKFVRQTSTKCFADNGAFLTVTICASVVWFPVATLMLYTCAVSVSSVLVFTTWRYAMPARYMPLSCVSPSICLCLSRWYCVKTAKRLLFDDKSPINGVWSGSYDPFSAVTSWFRNS